MTVSQRFFACAQACSYMGMGQRKRGYDCLRCSKSPTRTGAGCRCAALASSPRQGHSQRPEPRGIEGFGQKWNACFGLMTPSCNAKTRIRFAPEPKPKPSLQLPWPTSQSSPAHYIWAHDPKRIRGSREKKKAAPPGASRASISVTAKQSCPITMACRASQLAVSIGRACNVAPCSSSAGSIHAY